MTILQNPHLTFKSVKLLDDLKVLSLILTIYHLLKPTYFHSHIYLSVIHPYLAQFFAFAVYVMVSCNS